MKRHLSSLQALAILLLAAMAFTSCKTTEANYRAAYEKALAGRDSVPGYESTIYGKYRRQLRDQTLVCAGDTIDVKVQAVAVTDAPQGGSAADLKKYSVVVGQFKQLFNARSLRDRLVEAGYARTFVVHTAEPYYFIVLDSYESLPQARQLLDSVVANAASMPVAMKAPLPFLLQNF